MQEGHLLAAADGVRAQQNQAMKKSGAVGMRRSVMPRVIMKAMTRYPLTLKVRKMLVLGSGIARIRSEYLRTTPVNMNQKPAN